ncbi:MAG: hypothetical protein OEW33_16915, partial [Nitrospirota bacterium]|nr:hypothetical protein [Nitrospirota bacterium]
MSFGENSNIQIAFWEGPQIPINEEKGNGKKERYLEAGTLGITLAKNHNVEGWPISGKHFRLIFL